MGSGPPHEDPGTLLLRLLARDTPADELASAGDRAVYDGGVAEPVVRRQVELALQVRSLLEGHRRQARELGALFDTASDLSTVRDLDAVLRAICRRAKDLLGTSAAWINLPDETRHDTYIHTTDGTRLGGGLRVPPGAGLAGLVASAGVPQWTDDYMNDTRLVHYHLGDEWTDREGVRSALGVPLRRGGAVTGVIMAADRVSRRFSPGEVRLLQTLADHAAIAIENARLFTETERAMADLSRANRKVRAHSTAIEMSVRFHDRLTELVLEGADLAGVLEAVVRGLGGRLVVVDPEGRVLACAGVHQDKVDEALTESDVLAHGELVALLDRSRSQVGRATAVELGPGTADRIVVALPPRSRSVGALLFTNDRVPAADQRLLERAALVVALVVLNAQSVSESEQHEHGQFLQALFADSDVDDPAVRAWAISLGVDLDEPHTLVLASRPTRRTRPSRSTRARASQLVAKIGGLAGELAGDLAFLLPGLPAGDAAALVAAHLRSREAPETVTAAEPVRGRAALAAAHDEARQSARILAALGRTGTAATAAQLGAYGLLLRNAGPGDAKRYVDSVIGPLLDRDAATKGVLVDTLNAYFEHGGHAARTAAALYVHVNTMYARLDRVAQLLPDWNDPDGRLQIQLAVRIHRLSRQLDVIA
jgi:GAF domain-containing protein